MDSTIELYNFVSAQLVESKRENINQSNTETSIRNIDFNGIIMLFDVLVEKLQVKSMLLQQSNL